MYFPFLKYRSHIAFVWAIVLLGTSVYLSWSNQKSKETKKVTSASLEIQIQSLQSRLVIGALSFFEEQQEQTWSKTVRDTFCDTTRETWREQASFQLFLTVRYIGCDLPELTAHLRQLEDPQLMLFESGQTPSEELRRKLGFFESLRAFLQSKDIKEKTKLKHQIVQSTQNTFFKFTLGLFVGTPLLIISLVFFVVFLFKLHRGSFRSELSADRLPDYLLLETFNAYLLLFLAGSAALSLIAAQASLSPTSLLQANLILILGTLVVLFWPVLWGFDFFDVREAVGLRLGNIRKFMSDVLLGPVAYITAWIPMFSLLLIYSLLLQFLGIDASQGSHPIVPSLMKSKNSEMFLFIVLLATVVAPLVEEVMFRGVLYQWMRKYLSPLTAIVSNGIVFAVVHPQGPIGIVPLTFIGAVLCLLREWRGSLVAPIVAHGCFNAGTLFMLLVFMS